MRIFSKILLSLLMTTLFSVTSLFAQTGSETQNNRPQWLVNPQSLYPQSMYLVAIGEGDNRSKAEADAAGNLARIFETRVETEELFQERYKEIVSGQSIQADILTDINRSVATSASQTLYNIQYADSYTDNLGRVYVLAYIDRHRTGDIYLDMIARHIEQLEFFLERASQADNNLHKYAYQSAAAVISTANERLLDQLQIIAPDYRAMLQIDHNHHELLLETRKTAHSLNFRISLDNDHENRLHSVIADMLTEQGFVVGDNGEIVVLGQILMEDVDLPRDERFIRWNLNLTMQDTNGLSIVTHSQRGREGHLNRSEAVARAFRAMEREIRRDFKRKIYSYFDNLVK